MLKIALGAAALALALGGAAAAEPQKAQPAAVAAKDAYAREGARAQRVLYVCNDNEVTRRSFTRQYGEFRFMTADEVMASDGWAGARCISDDEVVRLKAAMKGDLAMR